MRSLKNKPQVIPPTTHYPYGRIQDDDGSGTIGTPVTEQVYGDFHQFFSQLMVDGGLAPNEIAENEYDGFQLNTALALFINKLISAVYPFKVKVIDIGSWNMQSSVAGQQTKGVSHGIADFTKIRSVSAMILDDAGGILLPIDGGQVGAGVIDTIDNTTIDLWAIPTKIFDDANYSHTNRNRGWITVQYQ